jgi:hypothetical protein
MTCSCLAGFCPLCAGVTYRAPLAHRSGGQQCIPVRPAQAHSLPAERLSAGQEPDAVRDLRVNVIGAHHAPTVEQMDAPNPEHLLSDNRKP